MAVKEFLKETNYERIYVKSLETGEILGVYKNVSEISNDFLNKLVCNYLLFSNRVMLDV